MVTPPTEKQEDYWKVLILDSAAGAGSGPEPIVVNGVSDGAPINGQK